MTINIDELSYVANGVKIPLREHMNQMNRKQRRAFLADLKKAPKHSISKLAEKVKEGEPVTEPLPENDPG
ncbi:MAG: hypothetical protein WC511_02885 [Candidatus Pacearchaeota archaeon]